MSNEYTPSEEEVAHDYANMQDWRYAERRGEFDRFMRQHWRVGVVGRQAERIRQDGDMLAAACEVLRGMDDLIEHGAVIRSDFEGAANALRKALGQEEE